MKKKVIIIGAGPAGLTAAYELLSQSNEFDVSIFEAESTIGGISRTVKHNGNRMDIGGHRFFSKDERVMEWWKNMLPLQGAQAYDDILLNREKEISDKGPDPELENEVMLKRQRISRIYYNKKFFDYPISMKPQTFINMGFIQTLKAGCSYLLSCVNKKEEDSLENFYINRFGRVLYSMFFEGYTEKLWGRHPSEIAADWGSQRVKGLSIIAVIKDMLYKLFPNSKHEVETSLIEEFLYPKYGPGQLWEKVASEVEKLGGKIFLNTKVNKLYTEEGCVKGIYCSTQSEEEKYIETDVVFSSMPLKDLVLGMNSVPENVQRIANGLPYRDFVTIGLLFEKLNIKNETEIKTWKEQVPDCWIYVQDTKVKLGRIQVFNNWSPYLVKDYKNTIWIGLEYFCNEGDKFWTMTEAESIEFAKEELVKMGVINADSNVLDAHRELVVKAYPAYFDTYNEIDTVIGHVNAIGNLYCIGRNGQHRYNNMDHSMVTAFEAVNHVLGKTDDKMSVWKVNTEKVYHEKK